MRLIDADTMSYYYYRLLATPNSIKIAIPKDKIEAMPTIDAVPVVRCKDCINKPFKIHNDRESNGFNLDARMINDFEYYCPFMCEDGWYSVMPPDDFYCKNGEPRRDI